jgi:hypothetical protein
MFLGRTSFERFLVLPARDAIVSVRCLSSEIDSCLLIEDLFDFSTSSSTFAIDRGETRLLASDQLTTIT